MIFYTRLKACSVIFLFFITLFLQNLLAAELPLPAQTDAGQVSISAVSESELIFNLWKDMQLEAKVPVACSYCKGYMIDVICLGCNTLYFNVLAGQQNSLGKVFSHPLSNFYSQAEDSSLNRLCIDGKFYLTSEHYFQSERHIQAAVFGRQQGCSFTSFEDVEEQILHSPVPGKAWYYGKRYAWQVGGMDQVRIMKKALSAKFTQNQQLKRLLLETGTAFLVYSVATDPFWGNGSGGESCNFLGALLMQLRDLLRNPSLFGTA